MKPIHIMAMAIGLCTISQVYAGEVFTALSTAAESREYRDVTDDATDSWGTVQTNDDNGGRFLMLFHLNKDGSVTRTPYANSLISGLKPKGSEIVHGLNGSDGYIEQVWPLQDGTVLFSTDIYPGGYSYLYKLNTATGTVGNNAPDYNNKQAVMNLGERGKVPQADIRALHHRSLLETDMPNKASALYYGEFNTSDIDDRVALWKSTNKGDTWSKVVEWNTVGHQTRYIYGVVQNPYNGWIYILFGDADEESAIVAWDGVSAPPPDNTPLDKMGKYPGWKSIAGSKRVRTGDLLFTPPPNGKCVWIPDVDSLNPGENLYGQQANYDLTGLKATGVVPFAKGIPPILGARSNTGSIYWLSYRDQSAKEKKVYLWKSIDSGLNWLLASKVDVYTDWTAVPQNLRVQGKIMESVTTDYLTINGRDLEFVANGQKQGSSALFSSTTLYSKRPPVTEPDTMTILRGSSKVFDLAKNDSAIEGSTTTIIDLPEHGSVLASCCGKAQYSPDPGFAGEDSFSYALQNASGTSNTAKVTVYVIDAKNDTYNATSNTANIQSVSVTTATGVGKNDLPGNVAKRKFALVSRIKRIAGSGKGGIALKFNTNNGSFSYTLQAPNTAVTKVQRQAAKRGTYQFSYAMTLNGVTTPAAKVNIIVK